MMNTKIPVLFFGLLGIVLILFGAFLKITQFSFGPFTGNIAVSIGLISELIAILFLIPLIFKKGRA